MTGTASDWVILLSAGVAAMWLIWSSFRYVLSRKETRRAVARMYPIEVVLRLVLGVILLSTVGILAVALWLGTDIFGNLSDGILLGTAAAGIIGVVLAGAAAALVAIRARRNKRLVH